jgi:cytoskeleton protein RodZ
MTNDNLQTGSFNDQNSIPLGMRFQSAREAMGLDRKDVAAQLRLHEKVITMIESGEFKTDLPLTFIRGYIRNYAKLLAIPENEVKEGLDLLQPKQQKEEPVPEPVPAAAQTPASGPVSTVTHSMPISIGNFFMQFFTYLIAITLIGLVGIWWHSHRVSYNPSDSQTIPFPGDLDQSAPAKISASSAESSKSPVSNPSSPNTAPASGNSLPIAPGANTASMQPASSAAAPATPAPANTRTSDSPAQPTVKTSSREWPQFKKWFTFANNPANKTALTRFVTGDYFTHSFIHLILFITLIQIAARKYSAYSHSSSMMASTRLHRKPRNAGTGFNFGSILRLSSKFRLAYVTSFFGLVMVAVLAGMGGTWLYKHAKFSTSRTAIAQPVVVEKKPDPGASLQLDADLEQLAPSLNFGNVLSNSFRVNAMQALVNQINALINQAADTKFALTDPSTPIGQFTYKKKYRRYHRIYRNYDDNNENDPYNDQTDTNND